MSVISPDRVKVLVVEDDSILIKRYRSVMAGWKMPLDVIAAGNGIDALFALARMPLI